MTEAQRAARQRNIEVLREYARAGVFRHNHDFSERTPYFRDEHGTLCAMAYLIERSGRGDLVDKVERTANNAYIPELAPHTIASVGAALASGGAVTWTLLSNPRIDGYLPGLVATGVGLGDLALAIAGAVRDSNDDMSRSENHLKNLNTVVGAATVVAGVTYLARVFKVRERERELTNAAEGRTRVGVGLRF